MNAAQNAAQRSEAAQVTQFLRVGSPPYRFIGQCLAHDSFLVTHEVVLYIELWQRQKAAEYVVAFTRWTGKAWCPDACKAKTITAAMEAIEQLCATQTVSYNTISDCLTHNPIEQIEKAAVLHEQLNRFQHLAGRALDGWTDLVDMP
jgi:hypothetical protein